MSDLIPSPFNFNKSVKPKTPPKIELYVILNDDGVFHKVKLNAAQELLLDMIINLFQDPNGGFKINYE